MLYYVKTDRIFRSLQIEVDERSFYFDTSKIETKKANEKRTLVYELGEDREDAMVTLNVEYSKNGNKTDQTELIKAIKKKGIQDAEDLRDIQITEDQLERAIRIFEQQSEVDFFINKNAKEFLQEQFKLWSYQYFWDGAKEWTDVRINQLQILKDIAFKTIDFVAQFEDELLKIWHKPKFVKNSNYVITLDRMPDKKLIQQIKRHANYPQQLKEWEDLGIDKDNPKVPIDTKHFKDLELEILGQFEDLDKSLDGWLIKSENYQALKTILWKFKERIQTIYIDPPFNLDSSDQFLYRTNYKDASWVTLLENRLKIAKDMLDKAGSIFVRCDYNGNMLVRLLMNQIFGDGNFRNEIDIKRNQSLPKTGNVNLVEETENLLVYALNDDFMFKNQLINRRDPYWGDLGTRPSEKKDNPPRFTNAIEFKPPEYRRWSYSQENLDKMYKNGRLKIENGKLRVLIDKKRIGSNWTDIPGYSATPVWGFSTENSEKLLSRVISMSSEEKDFILDFFIGSGTTTTVAHKLGRKWIGIELGEHFNYYKDRKGITTGLIVRMKEVLAGEGNHEPCGISREVGWQGGGFFKYYELEQYEEALASCKYKDSDLFDVPSKIPYQQYIFMKDEKMLKALEIDYEQNKVRVNLDALYPNIDIAETLSHLTGKWIKKISADEVEFEDGEKVDIKNLDYKRIKPLIWWR